MVAFPIMSSIFLGSGLGLYKKLALAETRASPRFPTAFLFYVTLTLVFVTPLFKYPSVASQMDSLAGTYDPTKKTLESAYYQDRLIPIVCFFAYGLALALIGFSMLNAMQHPQIRQSRISLLLTLVPVATLMAF